MEEVLFLVAAALPLLIGAMLLHRGLRVVQLMRSIQQPEQLGAMLSPQLRDSLAAEGIDPDRIDVERLRNLGDGSELHDRVRAELRTAFQSAMGVRGGGGAQPGPGDTPSLEDTSRAWSHPGAIDASSGGDRKRWLSAVALATLIACAIVLLQR